MEESNYIFESSDSLFIFGIVASSILSLFALSFLIRLIVEYKDKKNRNNYLTYFGLLVIVLLMIIYGTTADRRFNNRIKNNLGITEGTTIKHEIGDGYNHITFEFRINGKNYKGASGMTYNGQTIENIIVPNGKYKVLYNTKNPNESIMDFKIKK
jgi:hypothetical protein